MIYFVMKEVKGMLYQLLWQKLLSGELLSIQQLLSHGSHGSIL
jgi:hypothetical protein